MLFEKSSIDPGVTHERGTFSARRGKDVPQEHGKLPAKPGLVFKIHTLDGRSFYRLRPDNPGRLPKYIQPKGRPNRLDVHPRQHERIKQPGLGTMRYLTEGEKKVDAGVTRGLLMVGVSGVFNGQRDKGEALIDDWRYLPLEGERYSIAFDSDIETNPMVQLAASRYARLLREAGAEVFITLLPPAADGSKQGLDDYFANGGTVKGLELLTRSFDLDVVETTRLSRDKKLALGVVNLERRFWSEEWTGMGGHTDRDLALKLIEAARRHGKVHPDGIRVEKAQGPLAIEAKISSRTLWKSIKRLEKRGFCYRDNEGRKPDKSGAFVLRASVSHMEGGDATGGQATGTLQEGVPGDLHLRAPRLRWSRPKYTPKRGTVSDTRRVRQGRQLEPRAPITRLGKIRGAIIDVLDKENRPMDINELAAALRRRRARDLRRRNLPMLEEAGIITVDDSLVSLTDDWLEALDAQRQISGEADARVTLPVLDENKVPTGETRDYVIEGADTVARRRYAIKSSAYHNRDKPPQSKPTAAGLEVVRRSRTRRDAYLATLPPEEPRAPLSPLAIAMRDYLDRNPQDARQPAGWLGSTLWTYDLYSGKPTPAESKAAIEELGGAAYLDGRLKQAKGAA